MQSRKLKDALEQAPFRPFTIEMDNGKEIKVEHPELVVLTKNEQAAVVVEGEHIRIVDVSHMSSISILKKKVA